MWFYSLPRHDQLVRSPESLYRDYLGAVKYGNVFALDGDPEVRVIVHTGNGRAFQTGVDVAEIALRDGLATIERPGDLEQVIRAEMYDPTY